MDYESLFSGIIIGIILSIAIAYFTGITYKDGQIDVLNGKVSYEFVKQDNNSVKWKFITDVKWY